MEQAGAGLTLFLSETISTRFKITKILFINPLSNMNVHISPRDS